MKTLSEYIWRTGEVLAPSKLQRMMLALRRNTERMRERAYYHQAGSIPFDDIAHTDGAAEKRVIIRPPVDLPVNQIELRVHGTSGTVFTVSATGVVGWRDISVTGDGASLVEAISDQDCRLPANTECVFTISGDTASWTVTAAELVLSTRFRRSSVPTWEPTPLKSGVAPDASVIDGDFDDFDLAAGDASSGLACTFSVHMRRNETTIAADEERDYVPAGGQVLRSYDAYLVRSAAENVTFSLSGPHASGGNISRSDVLTGIDVDTEAKDQGNTLLNTLLNDWDDTNDDLEVRWVQAGASAVAKAYTVLYWG